MSGRSENIRFNVYLNDKQAGATTGNMYKQSRVLRSEIKKLEIGSTKWIAKMKELAYVNKNMQRIRAQARGTNSIFAKLKTTIGKFGPALGLGIGLASLSRLFSSASGKIKRFEKGLNELSAITGMVGSDLDFLKREAIEMSTATDKAGNKINMSATKILKAFKLVGSAKPELLKNKEALAEVTKQSIILSQATGGTMGLEESVKSLTTIMNQFNAPASEAGKFINALAAGSKFGAGEIPFLAKAMEQAGTVAEAANISIEKTTGILELFAEKGLKAERSGVNFRNIIIELQKDTDNYTDGVFDINKALTNLAVIQDDTIGLVKIFGKENITAAQILAQNKTRVDELTKSLTGTNTAYEQSQVNSKGLAFVTERLSNKWEAFILKLDSGEGFISKVVKGFVNLGSSILDLVTPMNKHSESIIREKSKLNLLVNSIVSVNDNQKIRNSLISDLQTAYPNFLKNLDTEKITNAELLTQLEKVNNEYEKKIKLAVYEEELTAIEEKGKDNFKQQKSAIKSINLLYEKHIKDKKEGLTYEEKVKALQEENLIIGYDMIHVGTDVFEAQKIIRFDAESSQTRLNKLLNEEIENQKEYNEILKERSKLNTDPEPNPDGKLSAKQISDYYEAMKLGIIKGEKEIRALTKDELLKLVKIRENPTDAELKKLEALNQKIADLTHAQELDKMEANEREIQLIRDKYQKLIDEAKGFDEQIKSLEELRNADIIIKKAEQDQEILKKQKELQQEIKDITFEADVTELENRKELLEKKLELARQNGQDTIAIENEVAAINKEIWDQKYEQELAAISQQYIDKIDEAKLYGFDTTALVEAQKKTEKAIRDKYDNLEVDGTKKKNDKIIKLEELSKSQKIQIASSSMDAISGLFKEGSVAAKILASGSAIINTYAAATAALAPPPVGLGPIAGIPLAVSTVIAGLVNVAKINSVQFAKGGISTGASHDNGGIHMIDSKTGNKVGEMEGGEPYMILSKETYKNNRELINSLLDSSLHGGGEKVEWMKPGYYPHPDLQGVTTNLRNSKYAAGTVTNVNHVYNSTQTSTAQDNSELLALNREMLEEFKRLKNFKAVIDLDGTLELKDAISDITTFEANAGL